MHTFQISFYLQFWTDRTGNIFIIIGMLLAFVVSIPAFLYSEIEFIPSNGTSYLSLVFVYPEKVAMLYVGMATIGTIVSVTQMLQYCIMFVVVYVRNRKKGETGGNSNSRGLSANTKIALAGFILTLEIVGITM